MCESEFEYEYNANLAAAATSTADWGINIIGDMRTVGVDDTNERPHYTIRKKSKKGYG